MLTETLFIFLALSASLLFVAGWRKGNLPLLLASGVLGGASHQVRDVGLLLLLLGLCLLCEGREWRRAPWETFLKQNSMILLGALLAFAAMNAVMHQWRCEDPPAKPSPGLMIHLLWGADVDYKRRRAGLHRSGPQDLGFREGLGRLVDRLGEDPWASARWYTIGKFQMWWAWDNFFNGDVYQYPMVRKGFVEDAFFLGRIHAAMNRLHWPIVIIGYIVPLLAVASAKRRPGGVPPSVLTPMVLCFSAAALHVVLQPLPRYSIPLQPFIYMLCAVGAFFLVQRALSLTSTVRR